MPVQVTESRFDPGAETNRFIAEHTGGGAVVTFTGLVRSDLADPLAALTLECYPALAINQIEAIVANASARFSLIGASVIHRYGRLLPNEAITQVMTAAPHRQAAFEAAQFLMDYLKTDAPFWKKETTASGERWVEHRAEDETARSRWGDKE